MRAAVVAVGDELLLGDVVNSNLAWLGRTLAAAGTPVVRAYEVGDGLDELVPTLRTALDAVDAVVVTGGLGPTSDDRTRAALAELAGVSLELDATLERDLSAWYAAGGRTPPETVWGQAFLPRGARAVPNPTGSAAGIVMEVEGVTVFALPGVPSELRAMVTASVLPALRELAGDPPPIVTRQLRVALLGESLVAARLAPLEQALPSEVTLSYLASPGEVLVRLTGSSPEQLSGLADQGAALLGDVVSGRDDETLAATVLRLLLAQGATVAVAESLTGGAVAAALVDIAGASGALRGGVVAYATDLKAALLDVPTELLVNGGPVQADVAVAMARGVRGRLGADFGVATTGVAGPDPQDGKPPGTVHVAVVGLVDLQVDVHVQTLVLTGGRDRVRQLAVVHCLDLLRRVLLSAEHSA